ncbi:GntR family transcriptional regulator [Kineococcus arenarius]|uniref:GntR family transcriptional regulator n=1 Tax=Kineococcus sp. SYSU DK007 TaxID=3383128 RepID=UPI003D7D2372
MNALRVLVDTTSPVPAYEQLRRQVATLVTTGALRTGDRLPAARALAADLGLALGTVQRAYRELELAGLVASRRRTGTVVTASAAPVDEEVRWAAEGYVERALQAGLDQEEVLDLVRDALLRASSRRAPAR